MKTPNNKLFFTKYKIKTFGNSMYPLLQNGDIVTYKKTANKNINIDDIVILNAGNRFLTHRVIFKVNDLFITKGDNNLIADKPVLAGLIIGKVNSIERNGAKLDLDKIYLLQHLHYVTEIISLLKLFTKHNIVSVTLKGYPLHLNYEKHYARRIVNDYDLLIRKSDMKRVFTLLKQQGFTAFYKPHVSLSTRNRRIPTDFVKRVQGFSIVIDLHTAPTFLMNQIDLSDLLYPGKLLEAFTEDCFSSKKPIFVENFKYNILHSSFLVVYLALHFFHHNYKGITRLRLLDAIIRKEIRHASDWRNIQEIVRKYALQNYIYPTFLLLQKYFQTPVSGTFLEDIKPTEKLLLLQNKKINNDSIFNDEHQIISAINRFFHIFIGSPIPTKSKILNLLNVEFILLILRTIFFISFIKANRYLQIMKNSFSYRNIFFIV